MGVLGLRHRIPLVRGVYRGAILVEQRAERVIHYAEDDKPPSHSPARHDDGARQEDEEGHLQGGKDTVNEDALEIVVGWCELAETLYIERAYGHHQPWQGPDQAEEVVGILCEQLPGRVGVAIIDDVLVAGMVADEDGPCVVH